MYVVSMDLVRVWIGNSCSRYMYLLPLLFYQIILVWVVIFYQVKNTCFIGVPELCLYYQLPFSYFLF